VNIILYALMLLTVTIGTGLHGNFSLKANSKNTDHSVHRHSLCKTFPFVYLNI